MNRREFLVSSVLGPVAARASRLPPAGMSPAAAGVTPQSSATAATRKILIAGGGFGEAFLRYMASLTGKERPRL
ncbi:MAG: peptidase E, partial [Vicinamibacterales bacterium]